MYESSVCLSTDDCLFSLLFSQVVSVQKALKKAVMFSLTLFLTKMFTKSANLWTESKPECAACLSTWIERPARFNASLNDISR